MGCSHLKNKPQDILHPQFNLTFEGLLEDGFIVIPEDVPIVAKSIGDTLVSYQFDDKMTEKSKPSLMICTFPVKNCDADSIESFFIKRGYLRICEYQNDELFEIFYVKHQIKSFFYRCTIDKKNYILSLCYDYPQID